MTNESVINYGHGLSRASFTDTRDWAPSGNRGPVNESKTIEAAGIMVHHGFRLPDGFSPRLGRSEYRE
jgi:hypothetical protein